MNENSRRINLLSKPAFKMIVAGFVLFACAAAFTPSAGVFRTIPFFLAGGAISCILSVSVRVILAFSAVMTLCTYLVSGRSVTEAVLFSVAACLLAFAGVYVVKFIRAAKRTKKADVRKKCVMSAVVAFAVSVLLCAVLCGNVVSFLVNDAKNSGYIEKNYDKTVEKRYTSYEALKGEYRTYVSFKDGDSVYGNADDIYVSVKGDNVNDEVRNYFEEKMLYSANSKLANVISTATWGYNITASDIAFDYGEILTGDSVADDYMDRVRYVVGFDSIFHENEKDKFISVCEDTVAAISASGMRFEKIILCGGDASKVIFSLEITEKTKTEDVSELVTLFDEKQVEDIGVTEMTILDYWKNK